MYWGIGLLESGLDCVEDMLDLGLDVLGLLSPAPLSVKNVGDGCRGCSSGLGILSKQNTMILIQS